MVIHPIAPFYNGRSKILILGSFPSVRSRQQMFFYGHPQNRFWRVLAAVYNDAVPVTVEEKRCFLDKHRVALWDVLAACDIEGSADSTIKSAKANDISPILQAADIDTIYVNGKTAHKYYNAFIAPNVKVPAVCLPSTSPANAAYSLDKLIEEWKIIKKGL